MTYDYTLLIEEIEEDGLSPDEEIYVIRKSFADKDGYYEIIDYEYHDIEDECECMLVKDVLKEMKMKRFEVK
ncbi:hypothetical protein EZV73_18195 [Acidaminobacter sp. JC074]|uniref:hypothetical protein n=1 Tax=Acidaminobacter sp. JC074 TaxID=2530199 RepID=UPI001F0FC239|nr:hypothetical protein [Acidaminobacter sp. JC074]MCH4889518.1 hypothetical protein [Acidaminobacter sp. JC074]